MTSSKSDVSTFIFCYIGSFLFIGASLCGVVSLMPDLQLAMSMHERPDTMTLSSFIEQGPKENAFIRLTDVDVDLENSFYDVISTTRRRGIKTSRSSGVIANLYPLNLARSSPVIAMRAPESYEEAWEKAIDQGIVEGRILPKMTIDAFAGMKRNINSHNASSLQWTIEPLKRRPGLSQSRLNLLYALLIGAVGLAIATLGKSSGGTLASFISSLGAPLRVRPFSLFWPSLYVVFGVALIGSSYEVIFDYGKLGNIYFNGFMLSLGYMVAQIGLGAVFSAVMVPGLYFIFDDASSNKPKHADLIQESGMTLPALPTSAPRLPYCRSEFRSPKYQDPLIVGVDNNAAATSGIIPENESIPVEILGRKLNRFKIHNDAGEVFYQLYLGCAGLVLIEQVVREGVSEIRFCSLLADGMMVVTTHCGNTLVEQPRQGSTALVQIIDYDNSSDLIIKLLDAHLTKCEKLKASRGTHVDCLLKEEAVNAWLYARRAVAEMQFQYGLAEFEVTPIDFGRFHYPTGPKSSATPPALPIGRSSLEPLPKL